MSTATLRKEKCNQDWLPAERFGSLSSWQEARQHAGRHGAGEVAGSSVSSFAGIRK